MLLLVILTIIEASARVHEYQNPYQFCPLIGAEIFKNTDIFLLREKCGNFIYLKYEISHIREYVPNQDLAKIHINNFGYRGPDITLEKPDNTYRIFVIGGSTVVGGASGEDATIPAFLQQKFDNIDLGVEIEVINAGVAGLYSFGEYFFTKTKLPNFEPDLIIVYDGWNDSINRHYYEPTMEYIEKTKTQVTFKNFPYYRTPFVVYDTFLKEPKVRTTVDEKVITGTVNLWKTRWIDACEFAKKEGFEMLIAVQPIVGAGNKLLTEHETKYAPTTDERNGTVIIRNSLAESLDEVGQSCKYTADLRNIFDDIPEPVYYDQGHTGDFGNEIVAQKLFELSLPIVRGR